MLMRVLFLAPILVMALTQPLMANAAEPDNGDYEGTAGYNKSGMHAIVWMIDPGTGSPVPAPPGHVSEDSNQYMVDLQCRDDEIGLNLRCVPGQLVCPPRAEDGKKGWPAVWKVAPRGIRDPVWTDWKPNGKGPTCLYDERPEDLLLRIEARIQNDFRQLPVNAGSVASQPSPHTLRGAETNFFADTAEQQFDVTILGQKVHIVATPVEYTWNYGDGGVIGPQQSVGGPLPEDRWGERTRTSHVYTQTGDYYVVLTSHFRGTYSVNGGPPLPIPGQGSFSSAPLTVSVWRSITRNYADNCLENPRGEGCPAAVHSGK